MTERLLTENGVYAFGDEAKAASGYRVMSYSGSLGGGSLRLYTRAEEGSPLVPVPDSRLSAGDLDEAGDAIQQLPFVSAGTVFVELAGAAGANATVSIR